jgi:hypothetical protein
VQGDQRGAERHEGRGRRAGQEIDRLLAGGDVVDQQAAPHQERGRDDADDREHDAQDAAAARAELLGQQVHRQQALVVRRVGAADHARREHGVADDDLVVGQSLVEERVPDEAQDRGHDHHGEQREQRRLLDAADHPVEAPQPAGERAVTRIAIDIRRGRALSRVVSVHGLGA